MLNKPQLLRRLLALCGLLLLCSGVALSQLFQLQILSGEKYVRRSAEFLTTTSTVSAARGEIDRQDLHHQPVQQQRFLLR